MASESEEKYVVNNVIEVKYDLHMAVECFNTEYIYLFLSEPSLDLSALNKHGDTVMHSAIKNKFNNIATQKKIIQVLEILLDKGIDINIKNRASETALHLAIGQRMKEVVQMLLCRGADLKICDGGGHTLAYFFINQICQRNSVNVRQSIDFFEFLCEQGMDIHCKNSNGDNVISTIVKKNLISEFITNLSEIRLKPSFSSKNNNQNGDTLFLKVLNSSLTCKDKNQIYIHHYCLKMLIRNGSDINQKNHAGLTALELAFQKKNFDWIRDLKNYGADISVLKNNNNLHNFCKGNYLNRTDSEFAMNLFMKAGCDINATDSEGRTPLYLATQSHDVEMVRALIKYRADVNVRSKSGKTPIFFACHDRYMIEKLLDAGAHVNMFDNKGTKPLDIALEHKNARIVERLLHYGASIDNYETFCKIDKLIGSSSKNLIHKYCIKLLATDLPAPIKYELNRLDQNFHDFYVTCLKEVEELKAYKINNRVSVYDFLHMDWNFRCTYIENKKLMELIGYSTDSQSSWFGSKIRVKFPLYHNLITSNYIETLARRPLLEPARCAWYKLTDINLPDVCVLQILANLPNHTLIIMIEGSKSGNLKRRKRMKKRKMQ